MRGDELAEFDVAGVGVGAAAAAAEDVVGARVGDVGEGVGGIGCRGHGDRVYECHGRVCEGVALYGLLALLNRCDDGAYWKEDVRQ